MCCLLWLINDLGSNVRSLETDTSCDRLETDRLHRSSAFETYVTGSRSPDRLRLYLNLNRYLYLHMYLYLFRFLAPL